MLHFYEARSTRATNNKALNFDVTLEQIEEHERDFSRSCGLVVIGTQNNMRAVVFLKWPVSGCIRGSLI